MVTGGSGFIGNALVKYLVTKYPHYYIINIDKLDYCSTRNTKLEKYKNYRFIHSNISEHHFILYILEEYNVDIVIHMAANTHVDNSFGNSLEFTKNNIVGTHSLLECCKACGTIKKFIFMSTDEVLGNEPNEFLEPTNPYSATKAAAEHLVNAYRISFGLPTIIVRCNNVYGPGQYPEKIIPKFILLLGNGKKLTLHGDGSNKRRYVHVDDVCEAYDTILHCGVVGETYGIGTDDEYSNLEIATMLVGLVHPDKDVKDFLEYTKDRPFNDTRYWVCTKKLESLGWSPRVGFLAGLGNLVK